jgi:DNA-damage-inducible protein J
MMSKTTTFSIRMDTDIKEQLDSFCTAVGMNTNTAINMFARVVVHEKKLPFEVRLKDEPLMGEAYIAEFSRRVKEFEAGHATFHELIEVVEDE